MELRGGQQDKRIPGGVPSSFSYGFTSLVAERSETRRRDGGTLNPSSQTLDPHILLNHHHHRQNHHFHQDQHHHQHHQNHPSSSSSSQPQQSQSHSHEEPAAAARDPNNSNNNNNNPDPDPPDHQGGAPFVPVLSVAPVVGSSPTPTVRYRECLKNHAASIGSHVVDGCGEFMPSGEEGTPGALKCAACDCHRNFHRKEVEGESQSVTTSCYFCHNRNNKTDTNNNRSTAPLHPPRLPRQTQAAAPPPPQPPPPSAFRQRHQRFSSRLRNSPSHGSGQPMMMAFGGGGGSGSGGGGGGAESSSEEQELNAYQSNVGSGQDQQPMSKKRFRTKFSQEQKDKMVEFADKIGWRFQKQYEDEIQQFCGEVGVKRQVLKVWMHNNKNTMKKKEL